MLGRFAPLLALAALTLSACSTIAPAIYGSDGQRILFASQDTRDVAFSAMENESDVRTILAKGTPSALPEGDPLQSPNDLDAFMETQDLVGLIVLKDGEIRLEHYAGGLTPDNRWTSFSVAKSITSTLAGAALKDGDIKSLDDPVTDYVPNLNGSAYADVTVRQVLTMTSGVEWNESYWNPLSDVARFTGHDAAPGTNQTVSYMKRLKRENEPGSAWNYNTGETNLLGVIVSKATGKPLADYLSEKIWTPYGMEADAIWALDATGDEYGGCCISARLRDYARYGQFMLDGAVIDGEAIVPDGWVEDALGVQVNTGGGSGYGYQWWTYNSGAYMARGIFGQLIAISPDRGVVIVMLGNSKRPWLTQEQATERYRYLDKVTNLAADDTD